MNPIQDYLPILKAYVERNLDEDQWLDWLQANAAGIQAHTSRMRYLRLKFASYEQAREILDENGVEYIPSTARCLKCGEPLLITGPDGVPEQLYDFIQRRKSGGPRSGHSGAYCPNGCVYSPPCYSNDTLRKELEDDFRKTHICHVTIVGNPTLPNLDDYKIYIDGNITHPYRGDPQPDNGEYVRLKPGEHRIVIREWDPNKPDRQESNTIHFSVPGRAYLHFEAGLVEGQLKLQQARSS